MLPGQECLYFRQLSGWCCSAAPLCYAGEALSYQVIRDAGNRAAILVNGDNKVQIPLETDAFHVNEQLHKSDAPPEIVQGRAMLSIASIGAALAVTLFGRQLCRQSQLELLDCEQQVSLYKGTQ